MHAFVHSHRQDISVCVADAPAAPRVPDRAELHKAHEVDPLEVPELADLFASPEDAAVAPDGEIPAGGCIARGCATPGVPALAAAGVSRNRGPALGHSGAHGGAAGAPGHGGAGGALQGGGGRTAEVDAAIGAALQTQLPALDSRLAQLPG